MCLWDSYNSVTLKILGYCGNGDRVVVLKPSHNGICLRFFLSRWGSPRGWEQLIGSLHGDPFSN